MPAFAVFSRLAGRRAFLAGWVVGASANAAIFYWIPETIIQFSNLPPVIAGLVFALFALATGLYTAVFAYGYERIRRGSGRFWPIGVAVWFTALEFANPQLFTYFQGVAWYQLPSVFLVTAITGVSGVTFLVMLFNAVVFQGLEMAAGSATKPASESSTRKEFGVWVANAGILAVLLGLSVTWSVLRLAEIDRLEAEAESIRVALVQPNYSVKRRRELLREGRDQIALDLVSLSRSAWKRDPDIDVFVWPEGALQRAPDDPRNKAALDFARETGAEIWTGAYPRTIRGSRRVAHNSAYRISGSGELGARYDKTILVPFGEYMPFEDVISLLGGIHIPGHFERGDGPHAVTTPSARFAFLICYEAIVAPYVRGAVNEDVELLVNLTVDAWYGDTSERSQHLMLAATQSAQFGVPLLRSTTTGISAVVDARGLIVAQTGVDTREVLVRDVAFFRVPSPYATLGDGFAWACVLASVGLFFRGRSSIF